MIYALCVNKHALSVAGRTADNDTATTCTVVSADSHDVTGVDPDFGSLTATIYDYRLNCPHGGPHSMSSSALFSNGGSNTDAGQQIDVVYDPRGVTSPLVAQDLRHSGYGTFSTVFLGILLAICVLLGVANAVYGERLRWRTYRSLPPSPHRAFVKSPER